MQLLADRLASYSVLLAEDDEVIRRRLKNTLNFYFHEVYVANCGDRAYDIFLKQKPNLIICDIEMMNGNGIELIKQIRALHMTTPVIILSAYSNKEYLLKLINLRVDHYLLKPTTTKELLDTIAKVLLDESSVPLELVKGVYLDVAKSLLYYDKNIISLRKKECDFLELLYRNKQQITSYEMIEMYVWGDKLMSNNALKTFIKELRKKLPIPIITNIAQQGYALDDSATSIDKVL